MKTKEILFLAIWFLVTLILIFLSIQKLFGRFIESILVAWLMIPLTYYLSAYFFGSKKIARWKAIKKIALKELNDELNGIFTDISNITNFDRSFTLDHEASHEEIDLIINKNLMKQLKDHHENKTLRLNDFNKEHLLKGNYGNLFKNRGKFLDRYLDRYMEYLEPSIIVYLLKIRHSLIKMDGEIFIWNKYKKNNWMLFDTEESMINKLQLFTQEIIDNLHLLKEGGFFSYN